MSEYLRRATPEDEVARLEHYKEMLLDDMERTLQRADRLARQIEDVDRAIEDEKPYPILSEEDKYVRGTE